ncbi:MAG: hypothetical protein QOG87_1751 [Actinomycetota bacterium]
MLLVHEVHHVIGRHADAFEACYRESWMAAFADTTDARLLWFLHQAHGTGPAYTMVTVTAVPSATALGELQDRVRRGDLQAWASEVDSYRHDATAKVLEPASFSPLVELDLSTVPTAPVERSGELALFMEDTAWPHPGHLDAYLERASSLYVETLQRAAAAGRGLLELVAVLVPAFGAGPEREVVLWQRLAQPQGLLPLLSREVPAEYQGPGTWMREALEVRDRWESRLLRVAAWSPLT